MSREDQALPLPTCGNDRQRVVSRQRRRRITAPSSVTVGTITGTGALYAAKGTGASFIDQSASGRRRETTRRRRRPGGTGGGAGRCFLTRLYRGGDVRAATSVRQQRCQSQGVAPGDVLELPGMTVLSASFGANSLSVTTDAGNLCLHNVTYANAVTGYTAALDPATGLESHHLHRA